MSFFALGIAVVALRGMGTIGKSRAKVSGHDEKGKHEVKVQAMQGSPLGQDESGLAPRPDKDTSKEEA